MVAVDVAASGSSPLARGLLGDQQAAHAPRRIIPARAGFTRPMSSSMSPTGDHPRSRGVYSDFFPAMSVPCGSSPLARGLPVDTTFTRPSQRIIPARAGFTDPFHLLEVPRRDHPRSRGVYRASICASYSARGSSPLARGLLFRGLVKGGDLRIIPARAGFTRMLPVPRPLGEDHPRSRGVYFRSKMRPPLTRGSSPLARGLLGYFAGVGGAPRIIPARAGFTYWTWTPVRTHPDHPRSRGVYNYATCPHRKCIGIIPARAGFTYHSRGAGG